MKPIIYIFFIISVSYSTIIKTYYTDDFGDNITDNPIVLLRSTQENSIFSLKSDAVFILNSHGELEYRYRGYLTTQSGKVKLKIKTQNNKVYDYILDSYNLGNNKQTYLFGNQSEEVVNILKHNIKIKVVVFDYTDDAVLNEFYLRGYTSAVENYLHISKVYKRKKYINDSLVLVSDTIKMKIDSIVNHSKYLTYHTYNDMIDTSVICYTNTPSSLYSEFIRFNIFNYDKETLDTIIHINDSIYTMVEILDSIQAVKDSIQAVKDSIIYDSLLTLYDVKIDEWKINGWDSRMVYGVGGNYSSIFNHDIKLIQGEFSVGVLNNADDGNTMFLFSCGVGVIHNKSQDSIFVRQDWLEYNEYILKNSSGFSTSLSSYMGHKYIGALLSLNYSAIQGIEYYTDYGYGYTIYDNDALISIVSANVGVQFNIPLGKKTLLGLSGGFTISKNSGLFVGVTIIRISDVIKYRPKPIKPIKHITPKNQYYLWR